MNERDLQVLISASEAEAAARHHEFICIEHLLYVLLHDAEVIEILENLGADVFQIVRALDEFFERRIEVRTGPVIADLQPTLGLQRVIQRSLMHARYSSAQGVSKGDLIASILSESDCHGAFFLQQQGISRLELIEELSHGDEQEEMSEFVEDEPVSSSRGDRNELAKFATDLNAKARRGEIDPLIGRKKELERAVHILSRRTKNNPLFVGHQGVGKTAVAEGLASRVVAGEVPESLEDLRIFSLDVSSLLAGTKYRGDFEKRFKSIIKSLERLKSPVLFIDEIHLVVGAGATTGSSMDVANLLKPILTSGRIRVVGSTTYEEYKQHFEKDRALARRFTKIDLVEPSVEETVLILKGLQSRYEEHHGVRILPQALRVAAELSAKFINDRFLPDKAIDVLDEAGAEVALAGRDKDKPNKVLTVKVANIEQVVARMAQIPPQTVSSSEREKLSRLESDLKRAVFGQDEAVTAVAKAIRRARAGLSRDRKPIGSFLFVGPTGVGKTEVARQVAATLGINFLRFDMSEYMEQHAVSRLVGAPPGYVGFEQGGLLTDAIIRTPHAVLLLDEIEKAHENLYNILLQVMDNATLTDPSGRVADFRNIILVMTSNVGSDQLAASGIGFGDKPKELSFKAVEREFKPEFRNRLDAVVRFGVLAPESVELVVEKFITELDAQLESRKISVICTSEARTYLAKEGYESRYGARSVARLIQRVVKDPLADVLLSGELDSGGQVKIILTKGEIKLRIEPRKEPVKTAVKSMLPA